MKLFRYTSQDTMAEAQEMWLDLFCAPKLIMPGLVDTFALYLKGGICAYPLNLNRELKRAVAGIGITVLCVSPDTQLYSLDRDNLVCVVHHLFPKLLRIWGYLSKC